VPEYALKKEESKNKKERGANKNGAYLRLGICK